MWAANFSFENGPPAEPPIKYIDDSFVAWTRSLTSVLKNWAQESLQNSGSISGLFVSLSSSSSSFYSRLNAFSLADKSLTVLPLTLTAYAFLCLISSSVISGREQLIKLQQSPLITRSSMISLKSGSLSNETRQSSFSIFIKLHPNSPGLHSACISKWQACWIVFVIVTFVESYSTISLRLASY